MINRQSSTSSQKSKVILLVEDNPDDEELSLRELKKSYLMHEVIVVRDGEEALDYLFGKGHYAERDMSVMPLIVVLDLKLPKIDGLNVLRSIRADERTKLLPVIILTSSNEEKDLINGYKLGAISFIHKPLDYNKFEKALRQLVRISHRDVRQFPFFKV